jgi:hypothetical protein
MKIIYFKYVILIITLFIFILNIILKIVYVKVECKILWLYRIVGPARTEFTPVQTEF